MRKNFYKSWVNFLRILARCFTSRYGVNRINEPVAPSVYVVHHQNLHGPITSFIWFDIPLHLWVFNPFCRQDTCYNQYVNYTFTKRFGMSRALASVIAFPVSFFVSKLMQSIEAIPVFRGSRNIINTINQSISLLSNEESLLICPDINYTDSGSEMGKMYDGFLNLDKYYMEKTNRHIPFVPLHISKSSHRIYVGEEIYFKDNNNFKEEKKIVYQKLQQAFSHLEESSSDKKSGV